MHKVKKGIIFLALVSAVWSFQSAHAATLFMTAPSAGAGIGSTVTVSVRINSDQTVNAVQGTIQYSRDVLEAQSVERGNSIFNIWLGDPAINVATGEITFLGGSTNAFSGKSMQVFDIVFKVRGTGTAKVSFKDSAVTAGDGTGASILSDSKDLSFVIGATGTSVSQGIISQVPPPPLPQQIVRPATPAAGVPTTPTLSIGLYPAQDAWYNAIGNFLVQWKLSADVSAVATALNQDPQFVPTVSEGLFDNKTFSAVKEGIWYLHVRFKNSVGWGATTHYRIAIDATPPLAFSIKSKEGTVAEVSSPTLQFSTQDQSSGIGSYRIFVDGSLVGQTTSTLFMLQSLSFGAHPVVVQAIDNAGNITESRLSLTVALPAFLTIAGIKITERGFFGTIIFVIIIGIGIGWWLGHKEKLQRRNRATIAGRDVVTAFNVIAKNIQKLLGYFDSKSLKESQLEDIKFVLKDTKEEIDKMKHYVSENVQEIEQ